MGRDKVKKSVALFGHPGGIDEIPEKKIILKDLQFS